MGVLVASLCLAIDLARSADDLGAWWREHQGVFKALAPDELAAVVAAKDRRKLEFPH